MNRGFRTGRSLSKRFSTATSPTNSSKPVVDRVGIFVFSTITLVTAGLGVWQLKRYDEKVLKIKETKKTLKNDMVIIKPDEVTQESLTLSMIQHRNQRVNLGPGTYLNHKEVLLGQRTGPAGKLGRAQGMAMNAQGYYVITPFVRKEDGLVVFVKRGWVPQKNSSWSRSQGVVPLVGVASSCERRARFSPNNDVASKILIWLEARALLEATDSVSSDIPKEGDLDHMVPVLELIEDDKPNPHSSKVTLPVCRELAEFHEESVTPLTHLTYSLTWFLLAAAGAVMTFYKFRKPRFPRSRAARAFTGEGEKK